MRWNEISNHDYVTHYICWRTLTAQCLVFTALATVTMTDIKMIQSVPTLWWHAFLSQSVWAAARNVVLQMTSVISCCGVAAAENIGTLELRWSGPCRREVPAFSWWATREEASVGAEIVVWHLNGSQTASPHGPAHSEYAVAYWQWSFGAVQQQVAVVQHFSSDSECHWKKYTNLFKCLQDFLTLAKVTEQQLEGTVDQLRVVVHNERQHDTQKLTSTLTIQVQLTQVQATTARQCHF